QRGRALRARPHHADRVAIPRTSGRGIGHATPEIHHRVAVEGDTHRGPDVAAFGEVALEFLADGPEPAVALAIGAHGPIEPRFCRPRYRRSLHQQMSEFAALCADFSDNS